ncbi:hypothetical protein TWF730_010524 [Orbilia blumenaviensis]|uniref:Uncharacterized protein n=1 Tax=Orbilia blumenaviensis TaxID=1796055 RepID=A0AAV9UNI5_9PEZI
MSSSTRFSRGSTAGSTPGPIRRGPRNSMVRHLVSSPYKSPQTIQNRNGWLPTLSGIFRLTTGTVGTIATVGGVVGRVGHAATKSLFSYVSKSTRSYMGWDTPSQPIRTSLTDGSLQEEQDRKFRERAHDYYKNQEREAEEAKREAERAAEVRELGDSLRKLSPQAPQASKSWTEELKKTGPAHTITRKAEDAAKRAAKASKNQKASSKATRERENPYRPTKRNESGFKDEFQENFKSDPSKDAEKLEFLRSYTGWKPSYFRNQVSVFQRLPKLAEDFDILGDTDHTENIVRVAEILSDRGFLKRQNIVCEITFEPVWGRKPVGDAAIALLPKVYIPEDRIEPAPSYQPREFSEEEREAMKRDSDFSAVRNEFRKQTIYDLVFHTPSDYPLPAADIELPDEDFEVSRDDPRFRQLWRLLPSVRLPGNRHLLEANAKSRLNYKKMVSRRDHWFWKVIQEVKKRDRHLAKVYTHFDLNRKRTEMNWDEFRRVHVIRDNNPPPQPEGFPVAARVIKPVDRLRLVRRNVGDWENTTSTNDTTKKVADPQKENRRRHNHEMSSPPGQKCWLSTEMDLSDEDNFPCRKDGSLQYDAGAAEYQAHRLARAVYAAETGQNQSDIKADARRKAAPKKVTFAPGHTLRLFEQEDSDSSRVTSPIDTHTSKKLKSADEKPVKTAQTSAGPGPRKPAVPFQGSGNSKIAHNKAPQVFTKPQTIGKGSANPIHASYQKSLVDVPREWRRREDTSTFSAWEEDSEEAGVFYELDIVDGKLPKGRGSWETELEQTRGPKRVRVIRSNGSQQDFAVWSPDGTLHDLEWVPAEPTEKEQERLRIEKEIAEFKEKYPNLPTPEAEPLPDFKTAFRTKFEPPKTAAERIRLARIMAAHKDGEVAGPTFRAATDEEAARWGPDATYEETARMHQRAREMDEREAALKKEEERLAKLRAELTRAQEIPGVLMKKRRRSADGSPTKSPVKSGEITGDFPRFDPFEAGPDEMMESPRSSRPGALLSPPSSGEDENSGNLGTQGAPGSKAKARLTGLFDPVQAQKGSGFTVVEDSKAQGSGDRATGTNDVFRPIVNGATLPRLGSAGEVPKAQSLLPSAPITAAPATPSAITPAEAGMFGAVKPSLKNEMSLDEGSSMDIDNTPQSAKKIRSPKEFGFVTTASTTMAETFKPTTTSAFDFGTMASKPNFGIDNSDSSKSFALGGPTSNPFAGNNSTFQFGATATSTAPSIFGVSTTNDKPSDNPFTFAGNTKPAPKATNGPFLFGSNKDATKPGSEPFVFGTSKPVEKAPDMFNFGGPSTTPAAAPPVNFGLNKPAEKADMFTFGGKATGSAPTTGIFGPTTVPSLADAVTAATSKPTFGPSTVAPSIFGTSTTAPSASTTFGAATSAPTNGIFGATSGATAAPSFTGPASFNFGEPTTSGPTFGANNTATSSASFTFGSTATTQPVQFGGELPKQTSTSFNGSFNFGATNEAPTSFGFSASTAAPASAATASATAAPIFGNSNTGALNAGTSFGADAGNMFGFQPPTTNAHGRTIKAPVSRKAGSVRGRR